MLICQVSFLAFALSVNFCTADAFLPGKNPAFFSARGGDSEATVRPNLRVIDESIGEDLPSGAISSKEAKESIKNHKQIRVTAKTGLGATRMPPKLSSFKKNSNGKTQEYLTENVSAAAISNLCEVEDRPIPAEFIAETALPTDIGQFRLRAYRTALSAAGNEYTGREPTVIYAAHKSPFGVEGKLNQGVHVRVHDQCLTSEVFGSRRCDCSQQLKMAMEHVHKHGGAVIYLQQEGRGIGLANKVAAYALQDVGLDTVDANLHLGLPEDCRNYGAIPAILHDMKIGSIKLMTNNPRKVHRLVDLGVKIDSTVPMVVEETNPFNHKYLAAKHDRMDHMNLQRLFDPQPLNGTTIGETYISENNGQDMATNAIQMSLTAVPKEEDEEEGCLARDDGYCFGRRSVEDAIEATRQGKMVVVVDDMNRENEGDLIMAADACTPEDMAFIVRYSSGVICIAMDEDRMDQLRLPQMITNNEDPKSTAFTVTVDAAPKHGITTGISSVDRAKTMNLLADMSTTADDFLRPGHIFPLRAAKGGVLTRDGHTEAGIDLAHLAGRSRAGILCEIVSEESPTEMMRLPEMKRFAKRHGLVLTSIVDLIQYRKDTEQQQ